MAEAAAGKQGFNCLRSSATDFARLLDDLSKAAGDASGAAA